MPKTIESASNQVLRSDFQIVENMGNKEAIRLPRSEQIGPECRNSIDHGTQFLQQVNNGLEK